MTARHPNMNISGTSRSEALYRQLQVGPSTPILFGKGLALTWWSREALQNTQPKDLFKISWISTIAPWTWKLFWGFTMDYMNISLNLFNSWVAPKWTWVSRVVWRSKWKWFVGIIAVTLVKKTLFVAPLSRMAFFVQWHICDSLSPQYFCCCADSHQAELRMAVFTLKHRRFGRRQGKEKWSVTKDIL